MALKTSVTKLIPVEEYDKLHMRSLSVVANGEVDDVHFNMHAVFRRYARGADTGKVDVQGKKIYEKHWMPEDREGATIVLRINHLEEWAVAKLDEGLIELAMATNTCMDSIQYALAKILEVTHSELVGSVEVV